MAKIIRWIAGLSAGAIAAYVVATVLNAQFVIGAHDVPVSFRDRINMTLFDVSNMPLYLVIIAVALLIGFGIASLVKRALPQLSAIAYPLAGAAAIGLALGLMYIQFQTVPISGARFPLGFLSQMLAGAFGGWVFALFFERSEGSPAR